MSKKITFEALIAKREQREADKLKVGMLDIPGSDMALEAQMPSQKFQGFLFIVQLQLNTKLALFNPGNGFNLAFG